MSPVIRVSDETYERLKEWTEPWETQDETVRRVLDKAGTPTRNGTHTPRREQRDLNSEEGWLEALHEAARGVYAALRARLPELGDDVVVGGTPQYIKFMVNGGNFAEVQSRKSGLYILVHPNGHNLEPGTTAVEDGLRLRRAAPTSGWTLDVGIDVGPDTDLDAVVRTLRKSYEKVRERRAGRQQ